MRNRGWITTLESQVAQYVRKKKSLTREMFHNGNTFDFDIVLDQRKALLLCGSFSQLFLTLSSSSLPVGEC